MSVARKILRTQIIVSEELNKIDDAFIKLCYLCLQKSRFIKNQEASALLSNSGVSAPLSNTSLIDDVLFEDTCFVLTTSKKISLKWMKRVQFLLAGDKFVLKLLLRQPGFTCSACRSFTQHRKRI